MGLELFEHNKTAYVSALNLMKKTGKAAVVHPTGTGKSFIAFKLCEDNKDKKICWLAPSEYIFKTQLENLIRVSSGYVPENIVFFTYSRLMNMQKSEMLAVNPDYIVLDEFHRCGARQWGNGVNKFLNLHKSASVLGLTATDVRYLDGQRNMSSELFDGNIASYMTLGEADVRGILNPPKYVMAVFSYQKALEKTENRIKSAKNIAVRNECERYLEQLRRILQNADGTEKLSKIGMRWENISELKWQKSYEAAKNYFEEHGNLNVPVSDREYSGVKLGRWLNRLRLEKKTLSEEQIKALDEIGMDWQGNKRISWNESFKATKKYAVQFGHSNISPDYISPEGLSLGLWLKNQRKAFDSTMSEDRRKKLLNIGFTPETADPWDRKMRLVEEYFEKFGNVSIPNNYVVSGVWLARWLSNQIRRLNETDLTEKSLSEEQIKRLEAVSIKKGVSKSDAAWDKQYEAAKLFYEINGHLNILKKYCTPSGKHLGAWLVNQRSYKKKGILDKNRVNQLNKIGMIWN